MSDFHFFFLLCRADLSRHSVLATADEGELRL